MSDLNHPSYWNAIYLSEKPGWDKGRVSPPIARLASEGFLPERARVVVPGAGRGHDAIHLASLGFRVTAIDFAEEAAKGIRENAAKAGLALDVLQADVFTLGRSPAGAFDAVCEHTCMCALDPKRWDEWAKTVHAMLAVRGIYFGVFYAHRREGGPPHAISEQRVRELFSELFELERLRVAADGFPERLCNELEFVFRKRG